MIINVTDDVRINVEQTGRNITVERRKVTEESRLTRKENVGKERWIAVGYFGRLDHAIDALLNKHFRLDLQDQEYPLGEFIRHMNHWMAKIEKALNDEHRRGTPEEPKRDSDEVAGPPHGHRKSRKWLRRFRAANS